jgi:cell division protein FtsI/penicillin-binding protein 2
VFYLLHNAEVPRRIPSRAWAVPIGAALLLGAGLSASAASVADALTAALRGTQASAVVLDLKSGALLASAGEPRRADFESAPGSALTPLLLEYALEHGIVRPQTEVYCRRNLHVGSRALPCTHPADDPVFNAERALAESCNTWFAELARRFTGPQLEAALSGAHIPHTSMEQANVEQRQLAVLGLSGVEVSPLELARAYVELLQRAPPGGPVWHGLEDSVRFGMADSAAVTGVRVLGKTGTASESGEAWTHGWFAGAIPGRFVVVVYVPHGDGGTAARLAQRFLQAVVAAGPSR